MAISTLADYTGSIKQLVKIQKNSVTSVAAGFFSQFAQGNTPSAGTLNVGNTANGLVHTDATTGYALLNAAQGSNNLYLTAVEVSLSAAGRLYLYDRLFVAGAYSFNSAVNLASQPSFSSRIPGGTDYKGLELWVETVTAFTGNLTIAVTYENENGAGDGTRTTGTIATGIAPTIARCIQLPLQTGDRGISKILSVTGTVATVGTFNVMILRPLYFTRFFKAGERFYDNIIRTGMPEIYDTTALYSLVCSDSTATGTLNFNLEISQN